MLNGAAVIVADSASPCVGTWSSNAWSGIPSRTCSRATGTGCRPSREPRSRRPGLVHPCRADRTRAGLRRVRRHEDRERRRRVRARAESAAVTRSAGYVPAWNSPDAALAVQDRDVVAVLQRVEHALAVLRERARPVGGELVEPRDVRPRMRGEDRSSVSLNAALSSGSGKKSIAFAALRTETGLEPSCAASAASDLVTNTCACATVWTGARPTFSPARSRRVAGLAGAGFAARPSSRRRRRSMCRPGRRSTGRSAAAHRPARVQQRAPDRHQRIVASEQHELRAQVRVRIDQEFADALRVVGRGRIRGDDVLERVHLGLHPGGGVRGGERSERGGEGRVRDDQVRHARGRARRGRGMKRS